MLIRMPMPKSSISVLITEPTTHACSVSAGLGVILFLPS